MYPIDRFRVIVIAILSVLAMAPRADADPPPTMIFAAKITLSSAAADAAVQTFLNVSPDRRSALGFSTQKDSIVWVRNRKVALSATVDSHGVAWKVQPVQLPRAVTGYIMVDGYDQGRVNSFPGSPTPLELLRVVKELGRATICTDVTPVIIHSICPDARRPDRPCEVSFFATTQFNACPLLDADLITRVEATQEPFMLERTRAFDLQRLPANEIALLARTQPQFTCSGWYANGESDEFDTFISFDKAVGADELKEFCHFYSSEDIPKDLEQKKAEILRNNKVFVIKRVESD